MSLVTRDVVDDDVSGSAAADQTAASFGSLGLDPALVGALAAAGISDPFPIQALCIPPALQGRDVCGKAKTGSGKTLAFGLPILQMTEKAAPRKPRALILVPTRELALQVADVLVPLAAAHRLRVAALYGGAGMEPQIKALTRGVDIVVATPGRLIDLGERGALSVSDVSILVLDEADRMADMGFMPQVEWVLRRLGDHQTLLFSATLDGDVDYLVKHYLKDPVYREVASEVETVDAMEHRFLGVHQLDKVKVVAAISRGSKRTLMFVRTKRGADRLVLQLTREGVKAAAIHGDLRQGARERALKDFSTGRLGVLVATDVAARGIHVDAIDIVVHYDPPEDQKAYLHRSGRTARAGEEGLVVTLVLWDQRFAIQQLLRHLGITQPVVEMLSNDPRLADLRSWVPEPEVDDQAPRPTGDRGRGTRVARPSQPGRATATLRPAPSAAVPVRSAAAATPAAVPGGAGLSPAAEAARAVLARKAAMQGRSRRGRR